MRHAFVLVFLGLLSIGALRAEPQIDLSAKPLIKRFMNDEWRIWTSPFRKSSYSSRAFTKYVVPFTLVTGALVATDRRAADILPNTKSQTTWSLRVSQVGAPYTLAGVAAATYLVGMATRNRKARETGLIGAEAIAHSQLVTLGLKAVTQRERPFEARISANGGTGFFRGGDSFPSGHASGSFALATVFAYEYGHDHRWVPFASYGLAGVVAASRMSGDRHYVSDLFTGSAVGFLIGRYLYKSHHDPGVDGQLPKRAERRMPQIAVSAHGGTVAWKW